jgi:peptidoglycan/xylan/chitin deacetylase (PgdA/CDA1 family)
MDDGYRDNLLALAPLLAKSGAKATVFLESRPLDERRLNWTHKYFWTLDRIGPARFAARYSELCGGAGAGAAERRLAAAGASAKPGYQLKRVLKYEVDPLERDGIVDAIFREQGGDERALCGELYLSWPEARALRDAGIELGCHTVSHAILSRLDAERQQEEIEGCARALERELGSAGAALAYPFGRRWDYDARSVEAARGAGYACAVNTHAGVNVRGSDPYQLKRVAIDDSSELALIAAEACGGFELLRKLGIDLSE